MPRKLEIKKEKICFVSLNSYSLLTENTQRYIGGAELQQVEIATELQRRGYEIVFITYGNDKNKSYNGIQIVTTYDRNNKKSFSLIKKAYVIYKKMKEVDADIYCYRTGSPGIVTFFGKLLGKKVIHHIASDAWFTKGVFLERSIFRGYLVKICNWFDIKLSDVIISQNDFQKSILKEKFRVNSIEIKNALNLSPVNTDESDKNYVLWVGTIRSIKQPEMFLKIAEHFPENHFVMIGGSSEDPSLFEKIKITADTIKNLEFKGFISHNKMSNYYKKAFLLVNTSLIEGAPNVFLEAWMNSIPVISLNVDPDSIIKKYKLGYHSKTFNQLLVDIKTLLENKELRSTMGKNGRRYVEENHDLMKIVNQYEKIIERL
jgi:glycosyltransferase involved in cell wall biosynthesis